MKKGMQVTRKISVGKSSYFSTPRVEISHHFASDVRGVRCREGWNERSDRWDGRRGKGRVEKLSQFCQLTDISIFHYTDEWRENPSFAN